MNELINYYLQMLSLFLDVLPSKNIVRKYLSDKEENYDEFMSYINSNLRVAWMTGLSVLDIVEFAINEAKGNTNIKISTDLDVNNNKVFRHTYKSGMDELIKELYDRIRKGYFVATFTKEDFGVLVNEICQAQRNACLRVYFKGYDEVATAQIERQDYEMV